MRGLHGEGSAQCQSLTFAISAVLRVPLTAVKPSIGTVVICNSTAILIGLILTLSVCSHHSVIRIAIARFFLSVAISLTTTLILTIVTITLVINEHQLLSITYLFVELLFLLLPLLCSC